MIYQILNNMYQKNIEIKEINNTVKLIYENGLIDDHLKNKIKQYKSELLQRLEENKVAREAGFLVYHHGLFYEYRYGRGAFLYIERLPNGQSVAWRANYQPEQTTPYKVKIIVENVPFSRAYKEATGFIEWMNKKRGERVG